MVLVVPVAIKEASNKKVLQVVEMAKPLHYLSVTLVSKLLKIVLRDISQSAVQLKP